MIRTSTGMTSFPADTDDLVLLEHPQKAYLCRRGNFTDFVKKDGSAFGFLEHAEPARNGSGECALFVAE